MIPGGAGLPRPQTVKAWLPSVGTNRATRHVYDHTVEIPPTGKGVRSYAFMFRCKITGKLRRWGYTDIPVEVN